jgi:DNA-binding CsgD family transcriptional regulator
MPARFLGGLVRSTARRLAIGGTARVGRGRHPGRFAASVLLGLVVASAVAWFIEQRVTKLMLAEAVARASDQVELGLLPRVTLADFEPPYTPARLDTLNARLASILDRARKAGSGVIRVNLFAPDGTVLYSDLASLRGQVISPLTDPPLGAALAGSAGAEIASLTREENMDLRPRYDTALEAYVPCIIDGHVAGAYEFYTEAGPLWPIRWTIWTGVGLGFTLLLIGVVALERTGASRATPGAGHVRGPTGSPQVINTGLVRQQPDGDVSARVAPRQTADKRTPGRDNRPSECWLSRRETEVLRLLATRRTYRDIAAELSVSEETIRSHVKSILHKLGQPDRTRAVVAAVQAGILPELSPAL